MEQEPLNQGVVSISILDSATGPVRKVSFLFTSPTGWVLPGDKFWKKSKLNLTSRNHISVDFYLQTLRLVPFERSHSLSPPTLVGLYQTPNFEKLIISSNFQDSYLSGFLFSDIATDPIRKILFLCISYIYRVLILGFFDQAEFRINKIKSILPAPPTTPEENHNVPSRPPNRPARGFNPTRPICKILFLSILTPNVEPHVMPRLAHQPVPQTQR